MGAYINGIGMISPQNTFGDADFLSTPVLYTGRLTCIEPDYSAWIDPKLLRRMSRIIRMGIAAALHALKEANVEKPDAIITGTAFGCLEDTGTFLTKMITHDEQSLNPTPFIQSTHNTIGSQVALLLQCLGYNQTYSQRGFSFEHALLDGLMLIDEHLSILVGGVDEMTPLTYDIMRRFALYKPAHQSSLDLYEHAGKGVLQGEGAAYFLLSAQRNENTYAELKAVATFFQPESSDQLQHKVTRFLSQHSLTSTDIDLLLIGKNGDRETDTQYDVITNSIFTETLTGVYKHLCGEYATANTFALWLSAKILKEKKIPDTVLQNKPSAKSIQRILIYNQYSGDHHSFILVEA